VRPGTRIGEDGPNTIVPPPATLVVPGVNPGAPYSTIKAVPGELKFTIASVGEIPSAVTNPVGGRQDGVGSTTILSR
jgi:hypothetical protein